MKIKRILHRTDKTRAEWTTYKLTNFYSEGTVNLDNAVQRGIEWDIKRNSLLISSLLSDDPIPPIYAAKYGDIYSLIDGKQRTNAIVSFLNDEYALEDLEPIEIEHEDGGIEEIDINGMTFHELDEKIQEDIKAATMTVIIINEPSDEKVCEIFFKLNNGKPLSTMTVTRVNAKSRKDITELGGHKLFQDALTKKALEKYTNEDIVVKIWAVLHQEEPSLESKDIRALMKDVEISDADKLQITKCLDRVMEIYELIEDKKVAKKILTRVHLVSVVPTIWKSIQEGHSSHNVMEWFVTFFVGKRGATINKEYNSASVSGSARKSSVVKRLKILEKSYNEYFKKSKEELPKAS